jgi:hypothetical protein
MTVPNTPEALFEQLAEPTLRHLFPDFDSLQPVYQKMVRTLHVELTKGQLTDRAFAELTGFILSLWRQWILGALNSNKDLLDAEDEIDSEWVDQAIYYARMDQYLIHCISTLSTLPCMQGDSPEGEFGVIVDSPIL